MAFKSSQLNNEKNTYFSISNKCYITWVKQLSWITNNKIRTYELLNKLISNVCPLDDNIRVFCSDGQFFIKLEKNRIHFFQYLSFTYSEVITVFIC